MDEYTRELLMDLEDALDVLEQIDLNIDSRAYMRYIKETVEDLASWYDEIIAREELK